MSQHIRILRYVDDILVMSRTLCLECVKKVTVEFPNHLFMIGFAFSRFVNALLLLRIRTPRSSGLMTLLGSCIDGYYVFTVHLIDGHSSQCKNERSSPTIVLYMTHLIQLICNDNRLPQAFRLVAYLQLELLSSVSAGPMSMIVSHGYALNHPIVVSETSFPLRTFRLKFVIGKSPELYRSC